MDPPARFLQKDSSTGLWQDVGDKRFREKVSQALREHQPFIKAVIECDDGQPSQQGVVSSNLGPEPMDIVDRFETYKAETTGLTDLLETEKRRQTFLATSTEEAGSVLSSADDIDQDPVEIHGLSLMGGMSLGDFSVSQGPSFSSFHSYPPFEKQSGRWESMMDETISTAFKIGLDFPESSAASSRGVSAQDISLLSVPDDGIGNQKIDWAETCLSLLDMPRPRVNKRVLSNASSNGTVKRCFFNRDKSHSF